MIKVENVDVWGFEHAVRGMRNPMNSWDKSDSKWSDGVILDRLGEADIKLMQKLFKAGTEHRKFARQIFISMDITAPLYWWSEYDTYKIGTTANSCSKMHKIHDKEFTLNDFSIEHLSDGENGNIEMMKCIITCLNVARDWFNQTKDKDFWWNMIQLLPSSYNQKRTVTMNYENVFNIIHQRENHKLDEWVQFTDTLKLLPYVRKIVGE